MGGSMCWRGDRDDDVLRNEGRGDCGGSVVWSEERGVSCGASWEACRGNSAWQAGDLHPERYVIGKPHPDRARQFKPFAALKGYYELLEEREREACPSSTRPTR